MDCHNWMIAVVAGPEEAAIASLVPSIQGVEQGDEEEEMLQVVEPHNQISASSENCEIKLVTRRNYERVFCLLDVKTTCVWTENIIKWVSRNGNLFSNLRSRVTQFCY